MIGPVTFDIGPKGPATLSSGDLIELRLPGWGYGPPAERDPGAP